MDSLISVIVPVYNVEQYLRRCVHSILKQTYGNFELILVDDGSTDHSGAICDELSSEDGRIIVLHQSNGGLSAARNGGLAVAGGEYIAFIDSDDYIEENMLFTLLSRIRQNDADMAICGYAKWLEDKDSIIYPEVNFSERVIGREAAFSLLFSRELSVLMPVAWNKLYKRKLWDRLRYPVGRYHEDEHVIHHLINQCDRVVMVPERLYIYSIRAGSIMDTRALKASRDWIDALLDRMQLYKQSGYNSLFYRQQENCIRMILWECKRIKKISPEAKRFIREMSGRIKELLKGRRINEYAGARLFSWMPVLYIRFSRLIL